MTATLIMPAVMMDGFHEYLRRLLDEKGMSSKALASKAGVHVNTVNAWLRGAQKPDQDKLPVLAELLGVSVRDLALALIASPREQGTIMVPETVQRASAGPGNPVDQEFWSYQPEPSERSHEFVAIRVSGTCMEPEIMPGDLVFVDRTAKPLDGDTVVVTHDGEALVKIWRVYEEGVFLEALNDQEEIAVTSETHLEGVVVEVRRRIRRHR